MSAKRNILFNTKVNQQNNHISPTPQRREYKLYTDAEKQTIIKESRVHGVLHTAKKNNMPRCTIYRWQKQEFAICKLTLSKLEEQVVDWVHAQREPISCRSIRKYALELINPIYPNFKACGRWIKKMNNINSLNLINKPHTNLEKQKIAEESWDEGIKHTARKYKLHRTTIFKWRKLFWTMPKSIPPESEDIVV